MAGKDVSVKQSRDKIKKGSTTEMKDINVSMTQNYSNQSEPTTSSLTNFILSTTSELTTTPIIPSEVKLSILLPVSVAVLLFLVIIFVCWLICHRKKEAVTETYNQYSHVDQTEFVDFSQDNQQISTAKIEYEEVVVPVSDISHSDNKDSGFSQTDDKNSNIFFVEKSENLRVLLNGPQFSEPKGSHSMEGGGDMYIKSSPLEVHPNFEFSPGQNENDANYFVLEPMNLNLENKTDGQVDEQSYFTVEPSQK